ncbi:phosphate/phosphite/phosphonate ABC transporters, periplasmic binding protein [Ruegeria denitrificans]|uniref:Phosphate/phosphite/phosphonate ABC transporters, periplasmic binding protein n=1 Tax=Ruegeria denitrificans TaxID=1715692 RepID=A0A0P1I5G3_9RHOB|nr:PhnD/SsuA/transferrin family substrate-binding protein [Ruegeria denitrificans]CUJ91500.1 phosphate/phosphite/phosphonate ABC transporters, periplasmic binding protein [Ruegeria denitrificans]
MIAMLGMYDMPALQSANDRFWALIRGNLGYGPDRLTRGADFWEVWQHPNLTFAQTCGMPYRTRLHGKVQLVGTPDYGLEGCPPGHYRSVFVARSNDPRDLRALSEGTFAYNEGLSQSGWAAPMVHLKARNQRPKAVLETGGHARSATAVADGRADYAALDALTWELLKAHSNLGESMREVGTTLPTPALPYITATGQDASNIARAVRAAIDDLTPQDRGLLHLCGLIDISADDYLAVPNPSQDHTI